MKAILNLNLIFSASFFISFFILTEKSIDFISNKFTKDSNLQSHREFNSSTTEISGKIFRDYNFDGMMDTNESLGLAGVLITAQDIEGKNFQAKSDADGNFTISDLVAEATYRVTFTNIPEWALQTFKGSDTGSRVQFVKSGTILNLGVAGAFEYAQNNPQLVVPCYVQSNAPDQDVIVKFSYDNVGTEKLDKTNIGLSEDVNSMWATAYSPKEKMVYTSAVLKRHIPLGSRGLDAIYKIDPFAESPNSTPWIELTNDLNIPVSNISQDPQYIDNETRGLNEQFQNDAAAFVDAGKVGIGGMELSWDEKTLYVVNLFDKKLYAIDVSTKELVGSFLIPDPICNAGEYRPWALGKSEDDIFVGVTCDGSSSGNPLNLNDNSGVSNLSSTVYKFENGSFTEVLNFALDYEREVPFQYAAGCDQVKYWKPWTDVLPAPCADGNIGYPTPLLSDIAFDSNGDMILGFIDRTGFQIGFSNYKPTNTDFISLYAGGEILKACRANNVWEIENTVSGCSSTGGLAIDVIDPDGYDVGWDKLDKAGEFFEGDYFHGDGGIDGTGLSYFPGHPEITIGSVLALKTKQEVITTAYDPVTGSPNFLTGGLISLSTIDGKRPRNGFQLYASGQDPTTLGKGIGLGEVTALVDEAPIQIGNYVWTDINEDGIQDVDEPGINGVEIELFKGENLIATTSTNEKGEYYFSDNTVAGVDWIGTGDDIKLIANTEYSVIIKNAEGSNQQESLINRSLTLADAGNIDEIDSDGTLSDSNAVITFTTADPGIVIHSLDFGFISAPDIECENDENLFDYCDYDNDGKLNNLDLDDDNDGILDINECDTVRYVMAFDEVAESINDGITDFGTIANIINDTSTASLKISKPISYRAISNNRFVFFEVDDGSYTIDFTFDEPIFSPELTLISLQAAHRIGDFEFELEDGTIISNPDFILDNPSVPDDGSDLSHLNGFTTSSAYGSLQEIEDNGNTYLTQGSSEQGSATLFFEDFSTNYSNGIVRISFTNEALIDPGTDDSYVVGFKATPQCDYDGDGLSNHLDLDSDDDGCPDALEGDGVFAVSDIQNDTLTGGSNIEGVPLAVGADGQQPTSTYDETVLADNCENVALNCDPGQDNDMDGLNDICDLDDDNDGILDVDECDTLRYLMTFDEIAASVNDGLTDFASITNIFGDESTASLSISKPIDYRLISANRFVFFEVDDGSYTIDFTFDEPIFSPELTLISLQAAHRIGDFEFELEDGTIISNPDFILDNPSVPDDGSDLSHLNGFTTSSAYGSLQEIEDNGNTYLTQGSSEQGSATLFFEDFSTNYSNGIVRISFTNEALIDPGTDDSYVVGFKATPQCDYDGDGLSNHLDLDSDDDGCPDALEGDGVFAVSDIQNDTLTGGSNIEGVPLAVGADGQQPTSTYDETVLADECMSEDIDNDNVPNLVEDSGPNDGDGNGDGIKDSEQSNVATIPSVIGNSFVTLQSAGNCSQISDIQSILEYSLPSQDQFHDYLFGLVDFTLECEDENGSADIVIYWHATSEIPVGIRKYGPSLPSLLDHQYRDHFVTEEIVEINSNLVYATSYTLTDGLAGDDSNLPFEIIDPIGICHPIGDKDGDGVVDNTDQDIDNDGILNCEENNTLIWGDTIYGPELVQNGDFSEGYRYWTSDFNRGRNNNTAPPATNGGCGAQGWVAISPCFSNNGACNAYYGYSGGVYDGSMQILDPGQMGANIWNDVCDQTAGSCDIGPFPDHTQNGDNLSLYIDPNNIAGNAYYQIEVPVEECHSYLFSAWINVVEEDPNVVFRIDGVDVAGPLNLDGLIGGNSGPDIWQQISTTWVATSTSNVIIELVNTTAGCNGNDIKLDDVSFKAIWSDTDGDGYANYLDLDSDNDGIPDAIEACGDITLVLEECSLDSNGDATYEMDADGDSTGVVTGSASCTPSPADTDGDGTPDYLDLDSDGDGCPDAVEAGTDALGTSTENYVAGVVDSCGLLTTGISGTCPSPTNTDWITGNICENSCVSGSDKDGDGVPDQKDLDDDNDGILDVLESCVGVNFIVSSEFTLIASGTSTNVTSSTNIDYLDMAGVSAPPNGQIYVNGYDQSPGASGAVFTFNTPLTIPENNFVAEYCYFIYNNVLDEDDSDHPSPGSTYYTNSLNLIINTDVGSVSSTRSLTTQEIADLDAGNWVEVCLIINLPTNADEITSIEQRIEHNSSNNGICTGGFDPNSCELMATTPSSILIGCDTDTDGDSIFDHLDLDSDNDGIPDAIEACGDIALTLEDCTLDSDGDATYETDPVTGCNTGVVMGSALCNPSPLDSDGDSTPDYLDLDSDGDGCPDSVEAGNEALGTSSSTYVAGTVDDCGLLTTGVSGACSVPSNTEWIDSAENLACDCDWVVANGIDLCQYLIDYPGSALETLDCDNGGADNLTECNNGGDPFAPADDCDIIIAAGQDICAIIAANPSSPLASADCDGGGVDNLSECFGPNGGTIDPNTGLLVPDLGYTPLDPADPNDDYDCETIVSAGIDICAYITAFPMSNIATLDCDGGGADNATECAAGSNPLDASDECTPVLAAGLDICAIIGGDSNHPLALLDCDGGGINNLTECNFGGDPSVDAADDCSVAVAANVDICAIVMNDPNHPLATTDCDGGGIDNLTECSNGTDPSNPSDDCTAALAEGEDLCALINGNPLHPLANADCDGGGVDNLTECNNGTDPAAPTDDCTAAIAAGLDICTILAADPSSPLATTDCDGGGVDNLTECNNGTDPAAPADDCTAAIASGLDICALIGGDVNHPLAGADCDGGGVDNLTECNAGADPANSADECTAAAAAGLDVCAIIAANPASPLATLDCDGGGVDNATECANGGDPLDAADECTSVIAAGLDLCAIIGGDASHPLASLDCDGGGIDNLTECNFGGDPSVDPSDDCSIAIAANVDICAIVMNDPNHPLATADCDGGGVDNLTECNNGADPSNPSDDCTAAIAEGIDLCTLINGNPTHPLATADCDGGGVDNITECNNGGDPADDADDCSSAIAAGLDLCAIIAADPSSPLATADCDGGGVDNLTECNNGTDPAAPADDCTAAIASGLDICALIGGDVNHPLAGADCDGGGVDNLTECNAGTDPGNSTDECTAAAAAGLDVCAIIAANPGSALATLDCDGGGVDNATECANGGDPLDAADECTSVIAAGLDLCAIIAGDANHPLASLDCDGGGIDNLTECNFGGDPSVDPSDDCSIAIAANVDICAIVMNDPNHPLATADCDGGGVDNLTECNNGADPSNPSDDCTAAIAEGIDLCALINGNPTHPLATADCDGGGVDNLTECNNGGDPADDADDCSSAIAAGLDICAIIAADPSSPLATADCDGGGVDNLTECNNGTDPAAPADDCTAAIASGLDICALIGGDVNHPLATADCDGGGVDNLTECNAGTDPGNLADECTVAAAAGLDVCAIIAANPSSALATLDCDGGGVDNATECANGGDPLDAADECTSVIAAGLDLCAIIGGDASHPLALLDCDGGGIDNLTECNFGGDPSVDPSDDCSIAIAANVDICAIVMNDPNHPLATADCDGGGVDNLTECNNGADPSNPSDDCTAAIAEGIDICALLAADPTNALATADCDGGGVDNITECNNGGDPADESDDCTSAIAAGLEICAIIAADPSSPLATADCDGGGVDNLTECNNGTDPAAPADDCTAAIASGLDICALIGGDVNHPLATADCDGGGVDNLTECNAGADPANSADECTAAAAAGLDVCAIIAANPASPLATLDCDGGGVDNATECANGGDPLDAADECTSVIAAGLDLCAIIGGDASHPLALLDCDGGGIDNLTECNFGGDPSVDPSDDCSIAIAANVDICAIVMNDPNHPLATADCDGGGVDNLTECNNGADPSNPSDDCTAAIAEGIDLCALINGNPTHPLASADCDGGGVDNITECNNGGDPADDADDCSSAIAAGLDLCAIIAADPSSPLATADCDGGGVDNLTECNNGTDPAAPADDCTAAIASGLDICALIGGDVNHPLATADCDGGGVDNLTECNAGTDPGNSADECTVAAAAGLDVCAIIAANPGSALATLDCDGGGVDNATECANGGDPLDAADECTSVIAAGLDLCAIIGGDASHPLALLDCDGGGIDNLTECNFGGDPSVDPSDDCSIAIAANVDICAIVMNDPNHPLATADCDGGGVDNLTECNNGADPSNPSDDCTAAIAEGIDICALLAADPTNALATADCDGGGVDNATECANGGDPADESDDCTSAIAAGLDICAIIAANPSSPLATADCDGGGVDNLTECNAGFDPADPADECDAAITANVDICAIVMNDPNHPLAMLDCDGGGVDNLTECQAGNDPANSADECDSAAAAGLDVCAIIAANPGSALATLDCDGGGVDNATECANGGDPLDAADECTSVIAAGLDVCAIIAGDASHPLASLDCDGGGIDNLTECNFGGEPSTDPSDDCSIALAANVDICAVINGDPNHPLATADCDGGGIDNLTECNNGTDPSNPADDCSAAIAEGIDICALIAADPTNALATADCDGGGVDNTTECNNGNDPSDPADDVAGITGQLWVDADGDGVQDPGEPGLEGVTVNLLDPVTGEVIATTTTDADGNYTFNGISSGDYQIEFDTSTTVYGEDSDFTSQGLDSDVNIGGLSEVFTFDAGLGDQDIIDGGIILTPEIGTVKWIIGSTTLPNGDLEVEFGLGIKNIGTVDLSNISLVDDLATQLGAGFISVVGTPVLINSDATSSPALNTAFDGVANLDVFTGAATDLLEPGQEVRLSITTLIDPTMAAFPLMNQADAQAFGRDANGNLLTDAGGAPITATDASDSGEMFENDNPGEPGDAGTSDDPTLIECFPANIIVTGEEDPICFGAAANLVVTSDFTNVQYQWTEVGSTTVLSTSATPSFSPTVTTDYAVSLTVFDDVCVFDLEDTITISVLPQIIIDVVSDYTPNTDCSPSDLSFEVLEAGVSSSFASYVWTGPNSFTSSEATPVIANAGPENNGSYTVLITDANGCTASATIQVEDVVAQSVSDPIITSSGPVCEGEAITLSTALQIGVNVSYTWTMPSTTDVSGQGTNEIVIFPLDESIHAGDYTVTVNVDGCEVTSAIFTVEALTGSMAMPSEAGTPICEGENMFLEANAPTGVTFAWSGPNGFTSDQRNPVLTNVSEANNGIYTLTVSNAEGCVSVSEITINSVLPPAETPTIAVNGPNCAGEPIELSTSTNGMMFEWIGPLGASTTTLMGPGLTTGTPNTSIDDTNDSYLSGDWRVQVTDANGCTSISEPISVGINDVPQAIIINNGDVCDGEVVKLSANTVEGASYAWYDADPAMGGNLISQEQNIEFFDMTPNTYTYYLQVDAQGCPSEVAFSSVTVNENPSTLPDFAYMSNVDCAASDLELIANTTGTGPFTYLWSGPNGFTSTQENPVILGAAAQSNGSYTLQIVDANGCQSEVNSLEVEGVETAVAQPVITSSGPACNGQTITLSVPAYAGSNVSYIWTTPSGFTNITGQTSNVLIISPVDEGVHTGDFSVQVVVDDCTVTSSAFAVEIFPAPTAAISATTSSICPGGELELFSNAANAVGYAWTGPNGFSSNAAEIVIPNVSTQNNGTYSLVVTSQSGCSSTVSYVVDNISDEGVTPTLLMDMDICAGEDIVLSTSAVGAQYEWISPLGDNPSNITTATSSTVVSMGAADYLAGNWSVRVTDANGCTTTSETVSLLINDIPVALARNNGPICEDSGDIQLIGNEVPNATYAWYQGDPATGGTLFSTDMSPTLFAPAVGVQEYYLVVSQEGCASAASMTEVDVTARPESTPAAVYNLSPDCALEDLNLESNAVGVGPFTYLWSGPNGFTSTQANPSIENITEEGNGSYSLSLIDANGCESFNTVELNNISNPQAQPVVSTTGVSCDDGAIVLSTQAYFGTNVTYTWTTPNGTVQDISGLETNEITISPVDVDVHDGDYTLTVVVDDCTLSSAPFNLEVLEEPIAAQPTAVSDGVCVGEDILLESEVAADYLWSGPNGFTSDLQFPVISNPSLAAAGTYFLTVFNEQGCQSDPVSIDITVDVQPAPPTIVVADNIICDTEDIVLRTSSQCDEYRWIGPGGSSVTTLANPLLTTTANNTTIPVGDEAYAGGMWSVICVNGNGCASENSAALMVEVIDVENPVPATSQFVACSAEEVNLFAGEGYAIGTSFYWYDSDPTSGAAVLISNQQNPTLAEQLTTGTYTYWLQIEQTACFSEAVPVTVTVPDAPIASATNDGTECISSTDDVNLSVELSNGTAPFSYAWTGPNGFVSVQANTQLPNAANGSSGVYVVTVTDANGCTTVSETIVDVTVVPEEPVLQYASSLCQGSEFVINAPQYAGEQVTYFWTGPNGSTLDGTYPDGHEIVIEEVDQNDAGDYEVYVVVNGCTSSTSSIVPVFVNTLPEVAPSNDGVLCAEIENDLNLAANVVGGQAPYTFNWSGPNGFNSQAENPQLSNLGIEASGTYTLYVTDANGCESVIQSTSVSVSELPATPTLEVSAEQICENGQLVLSTQTYNNSNVTYTWIMADGTMIDTNDPVLLIDQADQAVHDGFISVMVTVNGCTSYQASHVFVEVSDQPAAPALANTTSELSPACEGMDVQLSTPLIIGANYTWYGPNGFTSNLPSPSISDVDLSDVGTYSLVVEIDGCTSEAVQTEVYVDPMPDIPVADNEGPACVEMDVVLRVLNPDPEVLYTWYRALDNFVVGTGATLILPAVSMEDAGGYYVTGSSDECVSEASNITEVVINSVPVANAYAGEDDIVCEPDYTIGGNSITEGEGFWTNITPNGQTQIVDPSQAQTLVRDLAIGENQFVWTLSNGACENTSTDTISITYNADPMVSDDNYNIAVKELLEASILDNDQANAAFFTVSAVTEPSFGTLTLNPDGTFSYLPNENFAGMDTYTYELCHDFCPDNCVQATVNIQVGDGVACYAPTIITPNDDGLNDNFTIPCLSNYDNSNMCIFNRWGDEVYRNENYRNEWNGTYRDEGTTLPSGTYYYILQVNDGNNTVLTGYVFIQR